ncbi:hypothetical protein [uncultured Fibrella sp.]|uniref:hypothetical protein n=1 Tax=uncultured Fibrella sp. TaxID=1284596 RepID=UPI0035CC344D
MRLFFSVIAAIRPPNRPGWLIWLVGGLLLGFNGVSIAVPHGYGGEEPIDPAKRKIVPSGTVHKPASGSVLGAVLPVASMAVSPQLESQLDAALVRMQPQLESAQVIVKPDAMTDLPVFVGEQAESDRSTARRLMSYLDKNPDKVKALESLNFEDLTKCPIGLSQKLTDGSSLILGILEAKFTPTGAKLTIFARLTFTTDNPDPALKTRDLFLGVDNVPFTREGGLGSSLNGDTGFRAVLLGDFVVPMKSWTLVLRGGTGITDAGSPTYVDMACNSFKEASLGAAIIFPRDVLVPYDEQKRDQIETGRVSVDFRITTQTGLRNLLAEVSFGSTETGPGASFALAKHPKFGFRLSQLVVDLSDIKNADGGVVFPPGYEGDMTERWQGVYIRQFDVLLPNEFKARNASSAMTLGARDVLIDRTGVSGAAYYRKSESEPNGKEFDGSGWKLTLDALELEFRQNTLIRGGFAGRVKTPLTPTMFSYGAVIDPVTNTYMASVRNDDNLPVSIPALRANGVIYRGSQIDLVVKDGAFKPSARLSGMFIIGTEVGSAPESGGTLNENDPIDPENNTIGMPQVKFTNLVLKTDAPYVTVGDFRYTDNGGKVAGFPVSITRIAKNPGGQDNLWIDFGLRLALADNQISGSTNVIIKTKYVIVDGSATLRFDNIAVQDVDVRATTSSFDLDGYVRFYDKDYAKGFTGSLRVGIKKPFQANVYANAAFGYRKEEQFRFGYVDAFMDLPDGVPILPALEVNGGGLGIYFNMKPHLVNSDDKVSYSNGYFKSNLNPLFAYYPDYQVPFGFKLMVGLQTPSGTFKGRASVEFALDRSYGINSIGLAGSGVFGRTRADNVKGQVYTQTYTQYPQSYDYSDGYGGGYGYEGGYGEETPPEPYTYTVTTVTTTTLGSDNAYTRYAMGTKVAGKDASDLMNQRPEMDQEQMEAVAKKHNEEIYGSVERVALEGEIAAYIAALISFTEPRVYIKGELYINKDKLVGTGYAGRAVAIDINFQKNDMHIHCGTPRNRMGVRYGGLQLSAYLMLGEGIPAFPAPPEEVLQAFPTLARQYENQTVYTPGQKEILRAGTAFALGAEAKFSFDESGWFGFARGRIIAGFDIMLSSNSPCADRNWLAQGQLYAAAAVRAGVNRPWPFSGYWVVFDSTIALYMRGNGFKPFGVEAAIRVGGIEASVTVGNVCRN